MDVEIVEDVQKDFNILVGSVNGLLKGVNLDRKGSICKNLNSLNKLEKGDEISSLTWDQSGQNQLVVGFKTGCIKTYNLADKSFVSSFETGSPDLVSAIRQDDRVISAHQSGCVKVWTFPEEKSVAVDVIEHQLASSAGTKLSKGQFDSDEEKGKHLALLKAGRTLTTMVQSPHQRHLLATGGKENELQLWDMNNELREPVFRAKNVRHDSLELRVPVWISGIAFCPRQPGLVSAVSKHGHVRRYDVRSGQRRPVTELEWEEEAPTACCATDSADQILVGAGTGKLGLFDWRKTGKKENCVVQKYKGCVGSVRDVQFASTAPFFAAVGLDRFLRIYDLQKPAPVHKMYLKSKLNRVLLSPDFDPAVSIPTREAASEAKKADSVIDKVCDDKVGDDEKFWTKLKIIREKPKKRKGKGGDLSAKRTR